MFLCHQFCNVSYTNKTKIEVAESIRCPSRPQWQNSYLSLISTIHSPLSYFYQLYTICTIATAKRSSVHKFSHKSTLIQNSSWITKKDLSVSNVLENKKFPACVPSLEVAAWHSHALSALRSYKYMSVVSSASLICLPQNKLFQSQKTRRVEEHLTLFTGCVLTLQRGTDLVTVH